ncbi:MAG: amino acid ABC transporter permease, partial [Gammaproteobacteria bacterium]|nr:amino acid ABC transporter permease [Gammaproteobacteria bacterium]
MKAVIPGVTTKATTDLPVLHSHKTLYGAPSGLEFSHWLANISPWTLFLMLAAVALWPITVLAQDGGVTTLDAFKALWRWLPFLIGNGFVMTIVI